MSTFRPAFTLGLVGLLGLASPGLGAGESEGADRGHGEVRSGELAADGRGASLLLSSDQDQTLLIEVSSPAFTPWFEVSEVVEPEREELIGGGLAPSAIDTATFRFQTAKGGRYRVAVHPLYETWGGPFQLSFGPADPMGMKPSLDPVGSLREIAEYAAASGDELLQTRAELARFLPSVLTDKASVARLMRQFPGNQLLGLWDPRWQELRLQWELTERFAENKQHTLDALGLYATKLGNDHPALAAVRLQLAEAVWQTGEVALSGELITQALDQLQESQGDNQPLLAEALLARGRWLRRVGALNESVPYLEQSHALFAARLGERSLPAADVLEQLGAREWDRGDFEAATGILEQSLEIQEEQLGPRDIRLLSVLERLGVARVAYRVVVAANESDESDDQDAKDRKQTKKVIRNRAPEALPEIDGMLPAFERMVQVTNGPQPVPIEFDRCWAVAILRTTAASRDWDPLADSLQRSVARHLKGSDEYPELKWRADHLSAWDSELYERAQEIYDVDPGIHGPLDARRDMAESLLRAGELTRSRNLLLSYSSAVWETLGPEHLETAISQAELANQRWRSRGDLPEIAGSLEKALAIVRTIVGQEGIQVGLILTDLAMLEAEIGQHQKSLEMAFEARSILESQLAPESAVLARQLPRLAWTFRELGRFEESKATLLAAPADESLSICTALHLNRNLMLAELEAQAGELEAASSLVRSEIERCAKGGALGKNLKALRDILAEDYEARDTRRQAKGLDDLHHRRKRRIRILAIWAGTILASPLAGLAAGGASAGLSTLVSINASMATLASPLVWAKSFGDPAYKLAPVLDPVKESGFYRVVGNVLRDSGYYSEAAALYRGAIEAMETGAAAGHPRLSGLYQDLAEALWDSSEREAEKISTKDQSNARRAAQSSADILDTLLREALASLPEQQALKLVSSRPHPESILLSGALYASDAPQPWLEASWNWTLRKRSLVLDELAFRHQQAVDSETPETAEAWQQFVEARRRLAMLWVRGPEAGYTHWSELQEALDAREAAEKALAEASAAFRFSQEYDELTIDDVGRALPSHSALVEYLRVPVRRPGPTDYVDHYVALTLDDQGHPDHADLGPADDIDELVNAWLEELRSTYDSLESGADSSPQESQPSGADLRRKVWDPIIAKVGSADLVFVVLDGALHQVHLPALPGEEGGFVIDGQKGIHVLSSGRDLVRIQSDQVRSAAGMLVLGNPDFDAVTLTSSPASDHPSVYRGPRATCGALRQQRWGPLPESEVEVEEIASLYAGRETVALLTGAAATEGRLKQEAPGKRYLHIATHGFFLEGECPAAGRLERGIGQVVPESGSLPDGQSHATDGPSVKDRVLVFGENPLLLSGLVLAGANRATQVAEDTEDGIVTAEEIAALDLRGLEIAALSACDTGLGTVATGEGVFGLRRALEIAGAQTILMSLWSVPDDAAREWMTDFYEQVLAGESVQSASQQASRSRLEALRSENLPEHPYLWSGFAAAGDWR